MEGNPTVIVKKTGFLAAFATGFFTLLTAVVVCVTVLGVFGLRLVDQKADALVSLATGMVSQLRDWEEIVPPAIADAAHDRRALDQFENIAVSSRIVPVDGGRPRIVIAVENKGPEVITLLALDVVLNYEDAPIHTFTAYAATPMALDEPGWRGPLPPGAKREITRPLTLRFTEHRGHDKNGEREWSPDDVTIVATPVDLRVALPTETKPEKLALDAPGK